MYRPSIRSSDEIMSLILRIADSDVRIRAVLLNGSRANPGAKKDPFQDFDIVYIVTELSTFIEDHRWIDVFGDRIILQMPDAMTLYSQDAERVQKSSFTYLILLQDGNRIDLTLFIVNNLNSTFKWDSLTKVLLDKDHLFLNAPPPKDEDYHILCPTENEFLDACNEFWWVSTYIAKGLWREEMTYAKEMLETTVRPVFSNIIAWYIGTHTNFSVSFGKAGKYMKDHFPASLYEQVLDTYPDAQAENIWQSLFIMIELFHDMAIHVAQALGFTYNKEEDQNVTAYLKWVFTWSKEKGLL